MSDDTSAAATIPLISTGDVESTPLTITDFVEDDWQTTTRRLPGPGLPEASAWTIGVVFAHAISSAVPLICIAIWYAIQGQRLTPSLRMEELPATELLVLLGGDQWIFVLLVIAALYMRWGRAVSTHLNLTPMRPLHVGLVAALMLPVSVIAGETYRLVNLAWQPFVQQFPALQMLDASNAVELLAKASHVGPLPVMLLIIAVAPAISEELVFRGMVGRGLIARWGVVTGVLLSAMMFAAVHLHPVHAAAVLPIGIVLHFAYLTTKSFWAPVMLHLLNNAWATVATRLMPGDPMERMDTPASVVLLALSVITIGFLCGILYQTRVRYLHDDGTEWDPGYVSAEGPAADIPVHRQSAAIPVAGLLLATVVWSLFAAALLADLPAAG